MDDDHYWPNAASEQHDGQRRRPHFSPSSGSILEDQALHSRIQILEEQIRRMSTDFWRDVASYTEGTPTPRMLHDAAGAVQRELFNCAAAIWEAAKAGIAPFEKQQMQINAPVDNLGAYPPGHAYEDGPAEEVDGGVLLKNAREITYSLQHHLSHCVFHDFESPSFGADITQGGHFQRPEDRRRLLFQEYVRRDQVSDQLGFQNFHTSKLRAFVQLYMGQAADYKHSVKLQRVTTFLPTLLDANAAPAAVSRAFMILCEQVWLLHKLAMAFEPSVEIFRVPAGSRFDADYMENEDRGEDLPPSFHERLEVAFMALPGFILQSAYVYKARVRLRARQTLGSLLHILPLATAGWMHSVSRLF